MLRKYEVTVAVDNKLVRVQDEIDTNYRHGEVVQTVNLFYRIMLAMGFPPGSVCAALAKVAAAGGHIPGFDDAGQQEGFDFSGGGDGGE